MLYIQFFFLLEIRVEAGSVKSKLERNARRLFGSRTSREKDGKMRMKFFFSNRICVGARKTTFFIWSNLLFQNMGGKCSYLLGEFVENKSYLFFFNLNGLAPSVACGYINHIITHVLVDFVYIGQIYFEI